MSHSTYPGGDPTRTASIPTQHGASAPVGAGEVADAPVVHRRRSSRVLVILFVIAVLAAGGMTAYHFITKRSLDATIATQQEDVNKARSSVTAKDAELAAVRADLTKTKADLAAATKRAGANEACVKASQQLVAAGSRADEAGTTAAINTIFQVCAA